MIESIPDYAILIAAFVGFVAGAVYVAMGSAADDAEKAEAKS